MNQDERHTGVIIGIASDTVKVLAIWEAFRKLFLDYADEVIEALTPVAEALSAPYLSADEFEKLFNQADESCVTKNRSCTTIIFPEHPQNLPYQRRTY